VHFLFKRRRKLTFSRCLKPEVNKPIVIIVAHINQRLFIIGNSGMHKNSPGKKIQQFIFVVVATVLLASCSGKIIKMYSGETQDKESLAYLDSTGTLKTMMPKAAAVVITSVNSKATNMKKSALHPRIALLPGKHILKIELIRSIDVEVSSTYGSTFKEYKVNKTISFYAEAGHLYQVYALLDPDLTFPWFTWIEDKTGGKIVAGNKPVL